MRKREENNLFRPKCPKCSSYSIGLEKDSRLREKYVVCITCSNRIFGKDKIEEVFSKQYEDWKIRRRGLCFLDSCMNNEGARGFRREFSKYCSDKCRVKYSHVREKQRKKSKLSDI